MPLPFDRFTKSHAQPAAASRRTQLPPLNCSRARSVFRNAVQLARAPLQLRPLPLALHADTPARENFGGAQPWRLASGLNSLSASRHPGSSQNTAFSLAFGAQFEW